MGFAYHFEAKQLQAFIFSSSKLRDASGASELVNRLAFEASSDAQPRDLASETLKLSGLTKEHFTIHRRAGGVLTLTSDQPLEKFRVLWRLRLNAFASGLAFVDGIGEGEDADVALQVARDAALAGTPAAHPGAPLASPLVRMAPRTDRPPVPSGEGIRDGKCVITKAYIDEETRAKRQILMQGSLTLPSLFAGKIAGDFDWPVRFENDKGDIEGPVFPFPKGVPHRIAIIHIDGNGVGQMFQQATEHLHGQERRELSRALHQATLAAVQSAMGETVLTRSVDKVVPARPILIGGDDLTLVLRADLALDFTRAYITAFERETKQAFGKFPNANLPKHLTAKAGIVFQGVRQPFAQGYRLCESLASAAKDATRSRISFARLTSSVIPEDATNVQEARPGLWKKSWSLDEIGKLERLAVLLQHEDVGRGALRRVPHLIAIGEVVQAEAVYKRSLTVLEKRNPEVYKDLLAVLKEHGLTATAPFIDNYCPLLDAHDLGQVLARGTGGAP